MLAMPPDLTWSSCYSAVTSPDHQREVSLARAQGHGKDASILPMSSVWVPVERTAIGFRTGRRKCVPGQERADEGKEREAPTGNPLAILGRGRQQRHPETQAQTGAFRANRQGCWSCLVVWEAGRPGLPGLWSDLVASWLPDPSRLWNGGVEKSPQVR